MSFMKLPIAFLTALTLLLSLGWASCEKESKRDYLAEADCSNIDPIANTYTFAVKNILDNTCALSGCHDAATKSNGNDFSTYATAKVAFQTQDVLCAINHGEGCEPMPKGGTKLPTLTLNVLACWAKNGYPE